MSNITERLETAMLWLSLPSFGAGFALTAAAAYYGNIFIALLAIFFFSVGVLLYSIYRAPSLGKDAENPDEGRQRGASREFVFLMLLLAVSLFSFGVVANLFSNSLSNTEAIITILLPPSFAVLGMLAFFIEYTKGLAGPSPQPGPEERYQESHKRN
ncbi:MAG: hypothetical protein RXP86_11895 [Acidilobus sp.]